jgi:RNA polymerase sigma-70 factor (ECF subfamily)
MLAAQLRAVAASQDRAAFAALFRYFAPRLKSYLLRLTADPAVAEELTQETMVNVWRKAGQYDPAKATPSTWVFTIARNVRIDLYRREKRPEIDPNDPSLVPDAEILPDESIALEQSAAALTRAIAVLSDGERSVLHLSYFENLSHSVIAKRLGLPLGTVKSRLRLAFGKLREALDTIRGTDE